MSARRRKVPDLRDLLEYKNPEVVARFAKDYGIDRRTANLVFKDMLRFLWLSAWAQEERQPRAVIGMYASMSIVDEMWHTFLTYSRDYADFSARYFGAYLHHTPAPVSGRKPKSDAAAAKRQSDLTVELAWTALGPPIARRWFHEYRVKYPMVTIRRLQLQAAKKNRSMASEERL